MKSPRVPFFVAGLLLAMAAALPLVAAGDQDLTANEIVDRTLEHNSFGFDNAIARITLTLTSKRGSDRLREIEIRSLTKDDLGKSLVRFHSPADVAGTGFLVIENEGRDDDQYLFLPALGKVKRITGSQRNQRFMGTDLTYADLESRNLKKSSSKRLPDATVAGNDTFTIESIPKDEDDSQYGKTISWIHKVSFVALKVEFYDKKLNLLKTLKVKRLEKKDGKWTVMDSLIENVQSQTKTHMLISDLKLNANLSDDEFTQEKLKGG